MIYTLVLLVYIGYTTKARVNTVNKAEHTWEIDENKFVLPDIDEVSDDNKIVDTTQDIEDNTGEQKSYTVIGSITPTLHRTNQNSRNKGTSWKLLQTMINTPP